MHGYSSSYSYCVTCSDHRMTCCVCSSCCSFRPLFPVPRIPPVLGHRQLSYDVVAVAGRLRQGERRAQLPANRNHSGVPERTHDHKCMPLLLLLTTSKLQFIDNDIRLALFSLDPFKYGPGLSLEESRHEEHAETAFSFFQLPRLVVLSFCCLRFWLS
jgi:hypothetical protein